MTKRNRSRHTTTPEGGRNRRMHRMARQDARTDTEWLPATWHQLDLADAVADAAVSVYDDDPNPYHGDA